MAERRNLNPLLLVMGVIAGAFGAMLMTDEKTRKKAQATLGKATKGGTTTLKSLVGKLKDFVSDAEALHKQEQLDAAKPKKSAAQSKK